MSDHAVRAPKSADDPAFKLPAMLAGIRFPLLVVGLLVLIGGWAMGTFGNGPKVGMSAYLSAFVYCLTLSIGCLFFVIIQHLVRAGWSVVVRRVAELFMIMIIPLAILFIPILASVLFGEGSLYVWGDPNYGADLGVDSDVWEVKTDWLNPTWFTIRAVVYFAVWSLLAVFYYRNSIDQDSTGQLAATDRMQYWAGPAAMAFSLTTTFAAFDWIMSLAPMWFSTMFGVYLFAGSILAAHCLICLTTYVFQSAGAMRDEVTTEHYHDLGKLIFGFITFWTYIAFSQFLLIWYGNIPEETEWFYDRQVGNWGLISIALVLFHWLLPFMGTLSRHVRRRPWAMALWSSYLLILHYVDIYWIVMPEAKHGAGGIGINAMGVGSAVLCVVGMTALMVGLVLTVAEQVRLSPVRDPRFRESLAFENI